MNPNSNAVSTTSLHVSFVASPSAHPGAAASPGPQTNVKRVKMAVGLTLGIVGGFILLCCLMAIIRRSVGEQAQEGKILPGSRSKLKEYVIDHLQDGPYGGLEKEREHKPANDKQLLPAAYVSDLDTDPEFTSGKRPEAAQTSPPRPPETKKSPTMLKRDFFKPASHHPSRGNVLGFPAAFRKVSPSSIKSAIQDKFSSLKRQRPTLPLISRPLPFTLKRVPPQRAPSNPNTRRSLSSRSNDSHNHAQPGSSQSGAQWDSQLALHNALDSDRSFEGVVSLPSRGHTNNEEGIVGMNSHVFIKKERFSLEFPGIANTVSHSNLPYERSSPRGFSRSVSDYERTDGMELRPDISEEAVVSRAISVKVDRNSGPTARRYSSAAAAFEDTKRNTPTSSDQLLVSHLFGYSTGELTFSTSAPSITRPGPAVVKTKTHLRETPAPENGVRKVSNKVDVQSRVNAGPSDLARSSQALLYGEDSWTKY
ncbi:uncharacterized protein EI90DRAFT_2092067 [Cantharellus anzutake]|uniref:uncharacterized protein n=1 Tax=Cantharellus anzutake TaxID=1750568 RepID=UPI0019088D43|nr:uncharacterized protein EI90DRAFT_2092067 [Cantharellus anzutake]KAF8340643.1 hypothetical protein EI90DRAFT_2092067 [Cantharellus anzutake]